MDDPPKKLFMTMNFFNLPLFKTDTLSYGPASGTRFFNLVVNQNTSNVNDGAKPTYSFDIDF